MLGVCRADSTLAASCITGEGGAPLEDMSGGVGLMCAACQDENAT